MYIDIEYATKIMGGLLKSSIKRSGGNIRINARCPVCGDSTKDTHKARFWIFPSKTGSHYKAHCFNCEYSKPFSVFLKDYFPDDYRQYMMEKFKTDRNEPKQTVSAVMPKPDVSELVIPELAFCERLDTLPLNHPIVAYCLRRKIPENKLNRLWFTREWQKLVNTVKHDSYENPEPEPRLVIPIFNESSMIECFQGRALRESKAKYITIKAHEQATKFYGQDLIDPLKTVYITEGPIDSLFIDNSGAICGGQMALSDVPYKNNRVWVLDNEPHHPDTMFRLKKLIDQNEKVVLWDKSPWKSKDINEMIKSDNARQEEIMQYLKENTVVGLQAKLRFKHYDKSPSK
ncbi:DNA primase subunit [Pectobacterium phage POP12]|nr:DNA primase subunit [Pectobacterium phage POP12]